MNIPYVRQKRRWDCGLACAEMICRYYGKLDFSSDRIYELLKIESIWTIDLAFLLNDFNIKLIMTTITFGINSTFQNESFYMNHLDEDEIRIKQLFEDAAELRDSGTLLVDKRHVELEDLKQHLVVHRSPIILLVDVNTLYSTNFVNSTLRKLNRQIHSLKNSLQRQKRSTTNDDDVEHQDQKEMVKSSSYMGHFIIIHGYNMERDAFAILDPSHQRSNPRWISAEQVDRARMEHGTDEDIIFIYPEEFGKHD